MARPAEFLLCTQHACTEKVTASHSLTWSVQADASGGQAGISTFAKRCLRKLRELSQGTRKDMYRLRMRVIVQERSEICLQGAGRCPGIPQRSHDEFGTIQEIFAWPSREDENTQIDEARNTCTLTIRPVASDKIAQCCTHSLTPRGVAIVASELAPGQEPGQGGGAAIACMAKTSAQSSWFSFNTRLYLATRQHRAAPCIPAFLYHTAHQAHARHRMLRPDSQLRLLMGPVSARAAQACVGCCLCGEAFQKRCAVVGKSVRRTHVADQHRNSEFLSHCLVVSLKLRRFLERIADQCSIGTTARLLNAPSVCRLPRLCSNSSRKAARCEEK